jgi:hypothetical protein
MALTYRSVKGSGLTNEEIDNNFAHLDENKLEASVLNENNAVLVRDNGGNITKIAVAPSRIVGRLASGEIKALTVAELKTLLAIAISDVTALQAALDAKQDTIFADTGWTAPTGPSSKGTFEVSSVTTAELAGKVKAMYEALVSVGILSEGA